jgi:hypothetical protein
LGRGIGADGRPVAQPMGRAGRDEVRPAPPGDMRAGAPQDRRRPDNRRGGPPPFHFIVTDQDYKVLLGAGTYRPGEPLPEAALPQAAALCDKLREPIEGFPWHEVHPGLTVTMSMGVCADIAAGTAEAMLQKADALLYRAKAKGRNRVCFA